MGKNRRVRSRRGDSDHRSLTVRLDDEIRRVKRGGEDKEEKKWMMKEDWSDKVGVEFGERRKELEVRKGGIDEELEELIRKIKDRVIMKRKERRWGWGM